MEACCGSIYRGRVFACHGNDVRLMSPEYVRPYVKAQKNYDRDAATNDSPCRTEEPGPQLDMQTLHRARDSMNVTGIRAARSKHCAAGGLTRPDALQVKLED
jgi:hypothetical protein